MIFKTFKTSTWFLFAIFLSFHTLSTQAENRKCKKMNNENVMFQSKEATVSFPIWLSNQILHQHIPFRVNLTESDLLFSNTAYSNNISRKINFETDFSVTKRGKIKNCIVENLSDTALVNEIKRVISISRNWKASRENGKKITSSLTFSINLNTKGDLVILDEGPKWGEPDKRFYGKRYNLTRYIHQVAMHIYSKNSYSVEKIEYPVNASPVLGSIKFSFIVNKDGYFSNLEYTDDLHHRQIEPIITGQMFPGRLFSTEVKWAPAILDGKPVSVQVKAIIDYDNNEFSWDCFVLDEK
ncbi:hypothetical protein AALK14_09910 [Butyricimonas hominis]|uniref:hypothetical protein n=1 Tax=Butyricimonas TaxID=574697 RepID=UPI003513EC37